MSSKFALRSPGSVSTFAGETSKIQQTINATVPPITPHSQRWRTAAGSTAHNTYVTLGYDQGSERGGITYSVGTGVWTVPRAGVYSIEGSVLWGGASTTGVRAIRAFINGSPAKIDFNAPGAGSTQNAHVAFKRLLNAGDQIHFEVMQSTGATTALNVTADFNTASITYDGN